MLARGASTPHAALPRQPGEPGRLAQAPERGHHGAFSRTASWWRSACLCVQFVSAFTQHLPLTLKTSPTRLQRWDLPRIIPHAVASPRASKHADVHVHRGVLVRSPTARDGHPHRRDLRALLKAGAPRQAGGHRGAASACMPHGRDRAAAHSSPPRPSKPLRATQAESPARMSSMSSKPCISILPSCSAAKSHRSPPRQPPWLERASHPYHVLGSRRAAQRTQHGGAVPER